MEPSKTWGTNCQLTLEDGRTLNLERLDQSLTYAELYMGRPSPELNDKLIEQLRARASKHRSTDYPVSLVLPKREPNSPQEQLPLVQCIAFLSSAPQQKDKFESILAVAWFQDRFGDAEEPLRAAFSTLRWSDNALDICD